MKNIPEKISFWSVLIITLTLVVFPLESEYCKRISSFDCCLVDKDNVSWIIGFGIEFGVVESIVWPELIDGLVDFSTFVLSVKIFWIDSIGLKSEIFSVIVCWDDFLTSEISLEISSPMSLISSVITSLVLSTKLSMDSSILFSTDSDAFEPKFYTSSFNEFTTAAEVDGNNVSISFENTMPPKIMIPAIMPNFMNIS